MYINKYEVKEIAPKVYVINEYNLATMFVIEGEDQACCIDCGLGAGDYLYVVRQLTDKPVILACTHGHCDHIGGRGQFKTLRISRGDSEIIKRNNIARRFGYLLLYYIKGDVKVPITDIKLHPTKKEPMTMFLRQDDTIGLGGKTLKVIATPGHTDGSLSFLDIEDKILFTGDVLNPTNVLWFKESDSVETLKKTMEKVKSLSDEYDFIYPSHSMEPLTKEQFENGMKACDEILKKQNSFLPILQVKNVNGYKIYYRMNNIR